VQFVIIDLDRARAPEQQQLVERYYTGRIPHVVVLDAKGKAVYNEAGEIGESEISRILDGLFNRPSK
jgi:predicted transcriptional regulator